MVFRILGSCVFTLCLAALSTAQAAGKPLKVYILCGQSNMEGHAQIHTFPAIEKDPATKSLYQDMVDAEGKPVVCEDVYISYAYGDFSGDPIGRKAGKLTAGFGSQHHTGTGKIGPEFTFGIYTQKKLGEPILLIKNAWGGKSLWVDFRPPSGGDLPEDVKEETRQKAGRYYREMISHVKDVLADPSKVYPGYDKDAGFELAGFVWFQGFNDLVGPYPATDPSQGKKSTKDYSEYSRLLGCFIRDVRKELNTPKLPFVIGVLGTGGVPEAGSNGEAFRKTMAAPGESDEFKGTVANVFTHDYWPTELDPIIEKKSKISGAQKKKSKDLKNQGLSDDELRAKNKELQAETQKLIAEALTPDELWLLENGVSNQGFHYHGSAKFFAQIGKAFSAALLGISGQ
jgi:alpha-galactosidase